MFPYRIGFIGTGHMSQAIIKGLLESKTVSPTMIFASNRSPGKLQKLQELWKIQSCETNEKVADQSQVVILGVKPQDMDGAIDSISSAIVPGQIVLSLAAGISLRHLKSRFPNARVVRLMPNTPSVISRGIIGYLAETTDSALKTLVEDLFSPLGTVIEVQDEDALSALTVSCSSGTGFVFELMMYFQDWIEEHGFDPQLSRKMVVETFRGASELARHNADTGLEDLQNRVTSKKGVTAAGLESMREFEIERALRYSFEKAALRNQELAK